MNIVVTGAGSGIGRAVVEELLKSDEHHVLAISRSADRLQSLKLEHEDDNLKTCIVDFLEMDKSEEKLKEVIAEWNSIDLLLNNAGLASN